MAELVNPMMIFSAFYQKDDISDVLTTGCYGLRASAGIYAGILLVFSYENTKIQMILGFDYQSFPIKKFRYTEIWTDTFLDWVEL